MTPKQLRARFPGLRDQGTRAGNLHDMACPGCGQRESFYITTSCQHDVMDDTADERGDVQWNQKSECSCEKCGHYARVKDFTFPGLDDLLSRPWLKDVIDDAKKAIEQRPKWAKPSPPK